jgi:TRAP-type C4-dicarboxylate transport system substrate-binding protein
MLKQGNRRVMAVALAATTVAALASCGSDDAGTDGANGNLGASDRAWVEDLEPTTLRIADWTAGDAETGLYGKAMEAFGERITEATDGKVDFEYYYGTSLVTATDALQGVRDGVADISVVNSVYYPSELPVGTWLSGLGAHLTGSIVHDVAAGSASAFQTAQTLEPLVKEWEANNLYPLMTVGSAPYNLICTEAIPTPESAAGKQIRSSGAPWTHVIEDIGATTVNLSYNEIYEGLQRGVIDCVSINPNQLVSSLILKDVAPYYHPVTMPLWQATNFVMTGDVWEELPQELKQIMHTEAAQAALDVWNRFLELEGAAGEAIVAGDVVKTVVAPEVDKVAEASRREYIEQLASSAPKSVTNPEQVVQDYIELYDGHVETLIDQGYELPGRDAEAVIESFKTLGDTDYSEFFENFTSEYVGPNAPR